ncbi:nuclease homologue [Desulfofundulus australicus DSM 11792]|uniref:Nuclease homologue n=1 Tax=Desulfofundulus australicus DSM 11792 TaxID=1121425 RepID=A0A1M4ZK27_9FIRM|nr:thermonuclease family protein [Desulfofundulus australicus]SHF18399.1 nuclease homologue [Desulfofundulus australicus DSM 11792]
MDDGEAEVRVKMFNAGLVLNGYAQVMTVLPNVKYADLFAEVQREAREAGEGVVGGGGRRGRGGKLDGGS